MCHGQAESAFGLRLMFEVKTTLLRSATTWMVDGCFKDCKVILLCTKLSFLVFDELYEQIQLIA